MKLYRVSIGHTEVFAAGTDETDIYNRRETLDHTFAYLPIVIEEVKLEGYEIIVSRQPVSNPGILKDYLATTDKTELKAYLKLHDIEFVPQWGEDRLRELALQHYAVAN